MRDGRRQARTPAAIRSLVPVLGFRFFVLVEIVDFVVVVEIVVFAIVGLLLIVLVREIEFDGRRAGDFEVGTALGAAD